jgi:hypothetical protein
MTRDVVDVAGNFGQGQGQGQGTWVAFSLYAKENIVRTLFGFDILIWERKKE